MSRKRKAKPGCCPECGQPLRRRILSFEEVAGPEAAQRYRDEKARQDEAARRARYRRTFLPERAEQ